MSSRPEAELIRDSWDVNFTCRMNPFSTATTAKGMYGSFQRAWILMKRYGLTTRNMDRALSAYCKLLCQFGCGATFPITATILKRHNRIIKKYLDQNIEFAEHGFIHCDYDRYSIELQLKHLKLSHEVFIGSGIKPIGFRSPYLRRDAFMDESVEASGLRYVSNQPILWDVLDKQALCPKAWANYHRALAFYRPWQADERLSLPHMVGDLVQIPVSLPDDEILVDRLGGRIGLVKATWLNILRRVYQLGELFTLQLHPERFAVCVEGLIAVLNEALSMAPPVWCARLSEIAAWWRAHSKAGLEVTNVNNGSYHIEVSTPSDEITILARGVRVNAPTKSWAGGYQRVMAKSFSVDNPIRPFIGLPPIASPALLDFLREQGYIFEISKERWNYTCYLDDQEFVPGQERSILNRIEEGQVPLIRFGRWPNGARSALAVTGDIDALTVWDYGLRLLGK